MDKLSPRQLQIVVAVSAALFLLFDLSVPLGVAGGIPYVALVILGVWFPAKHHIYILAALGSAFTVIGFFASPPGGEEWVVLLNRALALAMIWIAAALIATRKQTEASLAETTDRLVSSQQIAHVGSWDWNIVSGGLEWTDEIYKIFGRSRDNFGSTYENFLECIHPEDRDKVTTAVGEAVAGEKTYSIDHRIVRPDGSVRYVHEMGKVYRDTSGAPVRMLGVVHDITERTLLDRAKNEFISTVSHELRTPLTSIKGSLGLLKSGVAGDLPDKLKSMLNIAYENSDRLVMLINDILDMEKIDAGKMTYDMQPLVVVTLLKDAIAANQGYGAEHNVDFSCPNCGDDVMLQGDKGRLMQVMSNLMSNAAKFSPDGAPVELSVARSNGDVRVAVRDYGPGIPLEFQDSLFKKFTQADASDVRQKGGTGLGLSITKAIVEAHGGTIGFESEVGEGSTFYFTLPLLK